MAKRAPSKKRQQLSSSEKAEIRKERALAEVLEAKRLNVTTARRAIKELDLPAEWRTKLKLVLPIAVRAGRRVYSIGVKIVETIVDALKKYPETSHVMVVGAVLTGIAAFIPVLGTVLAPLVAGVSVVAATVSFIWEFVKRNFKAVRKALAG